MLAGLAIAGPAATQGDPPQPTLPVRQHVPERTPEPTLVPLTAEELTKLAEGLCDGLHVDDPSVEFQGETLSLAWRIFHDLGPAIEPYYREFEVRYRITRRQDEISDVPWPWELLDEAVSDTRWAGGLDTGRWVYQVVASSVARDGRTFTCENTGGSGRATILNPANLAGFAEGMCPGLDVYEAWLESYSMDENYQNVTLGLAWATYVDDRLHIVPPYDDYAVGYSIYRKPEGSEGEFPSWELVDRVTGGGAMARRRGCGPVDLLGGGFLRGDRRAEGALPESLAGDGDGRNRHSDGGGGGPGEGTEGDPDCRDDAVRQAKPGRQHQR